MIFQRGAANRVRAWQSRPSLARTGTRPIGARVPVLVAALLGALVIHTFHREDDRLAAEINGGIVGKAWIIDGDTIHISNYRIRLQGIDAPESNQTCTDAGNRAWPCGRAATHELIGHLAGQPLKCESSGLDRYRRVIAVCATPDGSDVNAWLVQQGWALAYGDSSPYRSEEAEAQAAKRGIWAGSFVPPWEWRHRHLNWWGRAQTVRS
jgi:endonuclease YncB( thermonuclease family)